MLVPTHLRVKALRHAFEEALDDAREVGGFPDDDLEGIGGAAPDGKAGGLNPALEALDKFSGTNGAFVAQASLSAAYSADSDPDVELALLDPIVAAQRMDAILARGLGAKELHQLRRQFAVQNHPDRVPEAFRDAAQAAMADINAKIDKALEKARSF